MYLCNSQTMNQSKIYNHEVSLDYGAKIDAAIMNSLNKTYGFEKNESKNNTLLDFLVHINQNKSDQFNSTNVHLEQLKDRNSHSVDNDIIGMMWEPELDFVDDPESYNECMNKNGPMRYMCGVCMNQFRTRCALDIHFRIHKGEQLFKCVLCDNIFNELATLKQHRELHNINELVTCGICGLVFTEIYHMIKHRKYHFKEK
ncbi:zinc finger protein 534-like [Sipha flava]|uniref:Zinc finger protein 534-like n=1 Tax=Sipha flava TaxID=143950 RepID=A0A8B8FHW8_9HEMI|nr:zinc finger protein 534-like [Sipha flava]